MQSFAVGIPSVGAHSRGSDAQMGREERDV